MLQNINSADVNDGSLNSEVFDINSEYMNEFVRDFEARMEAKKQSKKASKNKGALDVD
jgi:hypothetical protein